MKRLVRFVLLTLGYLVAVVKVAGRRFVKATRVQRRKVLSSIMIVFVGLGAFFVTSANAANELGYNSTIDYSLTFNGTNPIQVADPGTLPTDFTTNFTVEAWINPGACTATRCMITNKENSWEWVVYNGVIEYAIVTNAANWAWITTSAQVPSNRWSHVAWVKSGTAMKFYVNGALADGTQTTGQTTTVTDQAFTIGGREGTADRFVGAMDEVKLWNTARSSAQILLDMHAYGDAEGANLLDNSALVGYYDFNEGTNGGAAIFDRTTNAKHVAVVAGATKPTYSDIKTTAILGGDTVYAFPRSYITPVGGWTAPTGATRARVLVVAGGGAGGPGESSGWNGPGGGAGGMRDIATASMSGVMKVTVGQGGFAAPTGATYSSTSGQDSFFGAESSVGGGAGLYWALSGQGQNGGSGSGAMMFGGGSYSAAAAGGTGIAGQGNAGGKNMTGSGSTNHYASGGGGGAGSAGGNASTATGGAAGNGAASDITGNSTYYAGGGAGAGYTTQGAANTTYAATPVGTAPTANTGSGGAGGRNAGTGATPGASGVVIVRYSPQVDNYWSRTNTTDTPYASSSGPIPTATTDSYTLEAWVRPTNQVAGQYYGIMTQQNAVGDSYGTTRTYLGLNSGQIHFVHGSGYAQPTATLPNNAWSHVAVTVTGTTVRIYIDAQLVYVYTSWTRAALGSYFSLGGSGQTNDLDWLGGIDQAKVWGVALSQDEIRLSMNSHQAPASGNATVANLRAHYDFNELTSAGALPDRSATAGSTDLTTTAVSPSFVENVETSAKANSRTAVRFTRNYLTAAGGWTVPASAARVDALVVAGGGGGGAHVGAGGGAGGLVEKPVALTPGAVIPIQVGQGGGGSIMREGTWSESNGEAYTSRAGTSGIDSILGSAVTAKGGGLGGRWSLQNQGLDGGSAGGSVFTSTSLAGTTGQGNAGGSASGSSFGASDPYVTGGGGGAGAAGGSPTGASKTSGAGGVGKISDLWANGTYYAGGGGGGYTGPGGTVGAGGLGGGGTGTGQTTTAMAFAPGNATANTGGGGGGAGAHSTTTLSSWGGNGGSGVIVLSYGGYLDLSNTPKVRRATQQFDVAPIIKIKNNDGSQLSGASHTVTVATGTIGNLTFNGTALSAGKTITASDGVFDFTGLGFAAGVITAQELTFTSPDFVDLQVTIAPKFNPSSVQIVADASAVSTAGYFDSTGQFYADAAASTNIRVSDLYAAMVSTDVRIDATSTISVDTAANTSASAKGLTLVAASTLTIATGNSLTTGGALTLTGSSVTINGPVTSSGTTLISSTSSTGLNTIAASVKNNGLNARTTFKSPGTNATTVATTVQTNKGPLVFWADSDGNDSGLNRTYAGSIFNTVNGVSTDTATDGGDMVFGGGLTADASDYPAGYGFSDGTNAGFDSATGTCAKTYYFTGGGKFIARGKTGSGMDALVFNCATQLWANAGQIDIDGRSTNGSGHGIQLQRYTTSTTQSEFFSSSDVAPAIKFTAISGGWFGFISGYGIAVDHVVLIQATGTGGVQIEGKGGGHDRFDIGLSGTDILSKGDIRLINQGTSNWGGLFTGQLANGAGGTNNVIGYCAPATCTNSRVTTSSANVNITGDRFATWDADVRMKISTAGNFKFEPNSSTGFYEFRSRAQGLAFSEDVSSVTIGKDQTTDAYTLDIYSNIKINGPIRLYGGRVGIYGNFESTRAGSEIRAKSNGSVYVYLSKTVKTNGGDVVFWSNADKAAGTTSVAGTIWLENSSSVATRGGKIWLGGGLDDGGADASITASRGKWSTVVSGDALPDGYAVGYNDANEWAIGVYLDTSSSLSSDGGDIFIAGAHGPTSGIGYGHILVNPGVKVDSGSGRIAMWGKSPVGSNVGTQGIALNYGNNSSPVLISSNASTSDAITIYSDSTESSANWSRGITAAWYSAWDNARGNSGVQIVATNSGGGITLTGIGGGGAGSSDAVGLRFDYVDILAKSGAITLNGMSSSSASSQGFSVARDNGGNSALRLGGWQAGTTGAVGGGLISTSTGVVNMTTSTSPININVDSAYMYEGGKGTIFGTSGPVSIMPVTYSNGIGVEADNFKRIQTEAQWRFGQTTFPVAASSFSLGRVNTSTDIAYYGAVNSVGDIKIYGGNLTAGGNLTTTALDSRVQLKGKVAVNQVSTSTIRTNSGKIVLWADSDNTGGGNMAIAGILCTAPTATTCDTNATADGDDIILGGGAADAADSTLPGGYASGTSASTMQESSGIQLGTLNSANTGPKVYSSGGNITIKGQTFVTASLIPVWTVAVPFVSGTELNSGAGKINVSAATAAPGFSGTGWLAGIEFNAWGGTTKLVSTNTATDAIKVRVENLQNGGTAKITGGNSGTSFANSAGGGLLIQADWIDDGVIASLGITGPIVIEPVNASFINTAFNLDSSYTFTANPKGLRLGKAGNTLGVTASTAVTSTGPIQLYGGTVSATADLTTTNASEILLKGAEDVVVGGGANSTTRRTLSTTGGPITLWSNSDYSGSGAISTSNFTSFLSRGGKITMAGSAAANEVSPTGFAVGSTTYASGVRLGSAAAASNLTVSSDGGDILIQGTTGRNITDAMGVLQYGGSTINSGSGAIKIDARTTGSTGTINGHGIELGFAGTAPTIITSSKTSDTAIDINGQTQGSSSDGKGVNFWSGDATNYVKISATGAAGNVSISGSASTSSQPGISMNWARLLSSGGTVTLNSGTNPTAFGNNSSTGAIHIGADTNGGATGNIDINAGSFTWAGTVNVKTAGDLSIDSGAAQSFASAFSLPANLVISEINDLRIGNAGTSGSDQNTSNVTMSRDVSDSGNVEVYGGSVALRSNITTTGGASTRILVKATAAITSANSASFTTSGADITFWADADASNSGNIWIGETNTFTTSGGRVTLAGGADDGGSTVVSGRSSGDVLPDGFAWGTGATTVWNENNRGVMLTASATINTAGGSVFIAGHGPNQFVGEGGQGVVLGRGTQIKSAAGKIGIFGVTNATGSKTNAFNTGVELQGFTATGSRTLQIVSSNGSSDAIDIRGDSSASTSESSPGVAAINFETRTTSANFIVNTGSGGVQITGRSGTTTFRDLSDMIGDGIELGLAAVLAKSGPITFTGDTSASSSGASYGFALDHTTMTNYSSAPSFIGSRQSTTIDSVDMSTSSSNITFNVDSLYNLDARNAKSIVTTGSVTVQPARSAQSFDRALSFKGFTLGAAVSGLTIGSAGTSAATQTASAITMEQSTSIAGTIAVYGGDVTNSANLTATGSTGSIAINSNGTFTNSAAISSAGGNQPTTIKADKAALTGSITSGTGITTITGFTAAKTIDLGLAGDTTSTLALTDTELDTITAGTIRVGDSTSGAITVSGNITIDNAKSTKFALRTAGNVTATSNATIGATNLGIDAGGTITLGGANSVSGNLALVAGGASGGSGASFGTSGAFTPATVDSIVPVYGLGKNISVSSAPAIGSTEVRYLNQTWSAPPVVTVKDAYGYTISTNNNTKSTYTTDVTDSGAPTVAGATPVISGGTQTFSSLKFTTSTGSTALTFTTAGLVAGGTSTVTTGTYSVEAGEPATIAITYDAIEAPAGKTGFGIRATLKDAGGNTVSGPHATDTITVDVSDADGNADLTNNATIISGNTPSTVAGVANFSNLILGGKVGVTYTLTFTVTYLDSTATSQTVTATRTVTLTPGDATKVKVQTAAAGFANRTTFSTQPIIAIKDAYDNTVTSSSASVSVAVTAVGTASTQGLSGTLSATASSGVATFAGLGKTGLVGDKRLTFSSSNLSSDTQDFTLTYGAAHHITSVVSSNLVNNTVFGVQPVVKIRDQDENVVADSTATVTLTSAYATIGGTLLNGAVAMDAVAGVANFNAKNVKLTGTIGAKTLTATVAGLTAVNSTVTISYGAATQLFLSRDASDAVNGVAFGTQPQVIVQDISGNTVTNSTAVITVESSGSALSGNSTPPTLANGVATFSGLKLTGTKGTYTLTYKSTGLVDASQPITVAYGAATKLILTTSPLGFVNRTNFTTQPVITVQDASGNTVENSSISIDVAIDSGNLTATTQIAAVNGVATFSGLGKNGTIGSKRLTFTKTGGGLTQAIFDFTLTYGAATKLALTTDAADFVNRVAFGTQPVIEIQDADGNRVADSTASVTVAMTGGGTLDGTDTVSAIAGVATFSGLSARGSIANNNVLAFKSSQLTGVSQASFNLTHGAAHHIYTTAGFNGTTSILSGTRKSGVAFGQQPKVAIVDEDNNLVSTGSESTQNVTVAADVTGLTGTTTVAAVGGLATYSGLTVTALMGNYTLTYTAATSGSTGTTPFYLSYGNASKLSLTTEADGFVNRTNFTTQPVVTVQDSMGNTVGDATISIDVAIDSGSLTGTTQVRSVAGVATFAGLGKYGTIGAKTLTFSKAGGGLTVDTQDFTLTYGAAHHISSVVSSTLVNNTVFGVQPVVKIRDQDENVVADSTATVTLTSSNATIGGTLLNGAVAMDAVAGVADFAGKNVKLTGTIGAKTLTATVAGLTPVNSTVTITYGAATKLFLSRDATDAVNGVAFGTQPQVVVQDVSGNTVANSTAVITVESSGSVLTGNSTPPTLANGVATFSGLTLTGDDNTFVLTYKSTGLVDAVQNITVAYGAATKLILTTSPLGFVNRTNFNTQPVITVQDASGNTVVNASMSIDVSSDTNDLTGTLRVNLVNGIATFAGLGNAGLVGAKHLTFKKVGGGLTVATFDYTLTYGAVHHLSMAVANTLANNTAWATQPVVTIQDEDNNTVEINSTVTLTASGATTVAIAGTTTMDAVDGVANFTGKGVKLTGLAGSKTLSAGITAPSTFSVDASITLGYGAATKLALTTEPAGFVNRTNFTVQPVVTVQDVSGNPVQNSSITIDVSIDTGDVTGTTRINAVNGVATFAGLGKTGTIGLKTLTFKDTAGVLAVDTKPFTLTHGAAHHTTLAVASSLVNATDFATQPVVTIYDEDNNVVTSGSQSTQTVTLTATGARTVAIGGAVTMDAADGVANFTGKGVKLTGLIGAKSLTATIASPSAIVATETVTVTYGAATKLAISTDAADAANGSQFGTQPVILVQDVSGNLVANSTVVVTPSVSDGTLDGTDVAGVTAVGGAATFTDLGLTATAGSKTLTFASTPLTVATQSITAVTGAPTQLRIDVANTLVNNTVFATQPVVTLLDASGIVVSVGNYAAQTVTLSSPDATIGGTVSMQSTAGVADFVGKGVKLEGIIGGRTLKASISSPTSVDATETVTITYGAAHHLHIASAASGIANRIAFTNQPAIEVRDISGNVVGNSTAQISVAVTGANAAVLGGDTSMNATSGIAYFAQNTNGLKLTGAVGDYRLTYSSSGLTSDSQDVTLTHGTATKIVVSRNAASAKSGQAFGTQPKIQVQDADSNLVNTGVAATAQVRMTVSSDAYDSAAHTGVDLLGPANFETATASAGEATFGSARLEGVAATYTLKFETVNTTGFNGLPTSQTIGLTAGTESQLRVVQQPTAIIAGAAFSPTVTVEILDAWKNRVLDAASNVAIKPTLVDSAVLGTEIDASKDAVDNSSGLVTFTGLTFTKAGTQFIRFTTATNLTAATSSSFVITNAQAHHLTWVNGTASFSAKNDYAIKDGLNANPELEVRDQYENPVLTGNSTTVAVTESTSSADVKAISGASVSSDAYARIAFANLVMRAKTGSYTLNFTAANASLPINGDVETATVSISHGDPAALRLTRNAAGANVGMPFTTQPKLNIEDTAGNVVADSALAVTVSENVAQVLSGTTSKNATAGSVDFTDSGLKLSGTVATGLRLKYAVTYNGTEISTSQDINLDPGLAVDLTIGQQPTTVKTRVAFNPVPTVILRDASGNQVTSDNSSTVTAQLKDAGGNPVGAETSAFTASGGLVTFTGLAFQAPSTENYYVTFKLVSNGVATTSSAFNILPGVATELRITQQPSTNTAGNTPGKTGELLSTQPIAKLYDQDGNLVTTANSGAVTVRVKSTDGAGDLSEGTVTASVTGGIATFSGVKFVGTPGVTYTLDFATATPNPALTSLASSTISVTHNDADHLVVTRAASGGRSGEAFTTPPIITIKDRYQNTVTSGAAASSRVTVTGEVTAPSAGSANLSGASATASGGVATLTTLTLTGSIANTYKLNFGVVGSSITSTSQTGLTISYGYEAQIALITQPVGGNATGTHLATQPAVEIRDSAGNRVANSTFTVAATINSTAGLTLLNGSAARLTGASKPAVAGVASFDALDLYGLPGINYELKFEVNGLPAITANPIQVNHALAHHLTITQEPVGGNATGDSLTGQPILQLRDSFENVVSADSTDVVTARLSTTSAREYLAGNSTATLAQGVATFSALKVIALPATDYTLDFTVTVAGNTITSSATNSFRVTYSTPTKLAMAQQPSGGTTGVALNTQPVIEVQDFYGNRVYNYVGNVIASVGVGATLTNTVTSSLSLAVTDGQAAFAGLTVTGTPATDYQLTFTSGGLAPVNSNNIQLTPGAPVRIEILNQPIGAQTGAALAGQPVVKIVDSFGNTVTQNSSTVITAALTTGSGGTLTRVVSSNSVPITATVSNGVATFSNLYMRGLTNHNYQMTFSSGDLAVAVSADYQVSHASVDRLVWNTQPAVGMTGSPLTRAAVLELQDLDGNIADTDNSTVVTAVVTSGSGALPLQYATATAANGVVTFSNLILTGTPGTAYKLTFTAVVGSNSYSAPASSDVIPTHAVPAKVTMRGANVTGGLSGANLTSQPALYVRDRFNNIATSDNTTEVTASIYNDSTGSVSGTTTARAVNGLVTFAGLKALGDPGTPYTLRFNGDWSGASLTPIDSNTFTVSKVADVRLAYTAQDYVPNARVAVQFSTDSPGDITFSSNASSLVCVLDPGTGDLIIKGVGSCLVRVDVDTDQDGFYLANHAEATLVISKARQAAVTITSAATVDYWSSLNPVATGGTGTGALSYSVVSGSTCRLIGATILPGDAGSLCQLTATRAGDANYLVETSAVQTIVVRKINQGTLTIASAPTMAVDNLTMFTAGGSGTGVVSYSIVSSGTAHCRIAGDVLSATAAGTCSVRATKAASTNYNAISSASQTITVTKEEQTVAFSSTAPMYPVVAGSYTPVAVATSGLAVTYWIATNSSGAACAFDSVAPSKINFTAEGVCEVVATQAGSSRYAAASVRQIIRVGLLNQTINFDVIPDLAFGTPAFKLLPTTNAGAAAVIGLATTTDSNACSISAGIVTLTAAGYCEIVATQTGYGSYAAATEVIRGFNVLADFAGAPRIFSSSVTTHALTASFTAPSYTGGAPITGFALIATDANGLTYENAACPVGASPITCTIVGLPNDVAYTAVARAITSAGRGTASNVTAAQTPMDAPMAVTNLSAATSNNDLVVSWSPPTALDGTFTRYDIFVAAVGSAFPETTPYNVTDVNATSTTLQNILNQTVTPTPTPTATTASARVSFRRASVSSPAPSSSSNSQGVSNAPAGYKVAIVTITSTSTVASNANTASGMQTSFSVPLSPSQLTLTVTGDDLMTSWSAPTADGGSAVTGYDVKVNGSVICPATTSLFCAFNGMQPGRTYNVEVAAINAIGTSAASAASHSVAALPVVAGSAGSSVSANGMAILGSSAKTISTKGGQLLTLNARNFAGVLLALLDGKPVKIVSNSEDHITLEMPEHAAGAVDLTFKSKIGTLVFQDAVTFVAPPRADAFQQFSRYRATFVATNPKMVASILAIISADEAPKAMVCVGLVPAKYTANDVKLAKIRAANVCAVGTKLDGNLAVRSTTAVTKLTGPAARAVKVTYKY